MELARQREEESNSKCTLLVYPPEESAFGVVRNGWSLPRWEHIGLAGN
jgi:hypothetical protein